MNNDTGSGKAERANASYTVGYGRPQEHRFPKDRSGNPAGRPKKKNTAPVKLADILNEPRKVTLKGQNVEMTKGEVIMRSLVERAIGGHSPSNRILMQTMKDTNMLKASGSPPIDFTGAREELARKFGAIIGKTSSTET